jgi:hypothetical protein
VLSVRRNSAAAAHFVAVLVASVQENVMRKL